MAAVALGLVAAPAALAAPGVENTLPPRDGAIFPGPAAEPPPSPSNLPARADNLELVGTFQVPGVRPGQIADVAVHKGFAYLNSWDDPDCEGGGTYVVDIRDPASPRLVTFIPAPENYYHGEGAHVLSVNVPGFQGDILAVNDETYGSNLTLNTPCAPTDKTGGGFDLYNVTDPANPVPLVQGAGDRDPDNDPATPERAFANSYHSVFLWQDGPRAYLVASDNVDDRDVDIFDITNPSAPVQVGDHDLDALFPQILAGEEGNGRNFFLHDMVVKHIGGRPVLKADYWDAGYVQLDVTDPANPTYITDTTFGGEDPLLPGSGLPPEGNAHQGEFSFDNQFLLAADEDFATHRFVTLIDGQRVEFDVGIPVTPGGEARGDLLPTPGDPIEGDTRFIGDGCVAAAVPAPQAGETVAVAERGTCDFDVKAANASAAGYDAILIFNNVLGAVPRCEAVNLNMVFDDPNADIKALLIPRSIGFQMIGAYDPATYRCVRDDPTSTPTPAPNRAGVPVRLAVVFDGWGYAHLYDAKTSELLDSFAIPEALDEDYAAGYGDLSIHEFATDSATNLAYASYYAGGIRVFRFSREAGLEHMGAWIAPGGSNFWGVEQFTTANGERLIAGSDRDFGLVILCYTGPGAVKPSQPCPRQPAAPQAATPATPVAAPSPAAVADRLAPRLVVGGVRSRGCTRRSFTVRVRARDASPLDRVVVRLNGRMMKRSTAASFAVRVRMRSLRPGRRNTLRVVAVDSSGNRSVTRRTFRRCAAQVQPPRFTG